MSRTRPCDSAERKGRLTKAQQFLAAAEMVATHDEGDPGLTDAVVTLCVLAGIAAADVICCARLGEHAMGESHDEAVSLLSKADKERTGDLRVLLGAKTVSAYSARASTVTDRKKALRAATRLVERAAEL